VPLLQFLCCSASVAVPLLQCLCCSASVEVYYLVRDPILFVGGPWRAMAQLVRGRVVTMLYRYIYIHLCGVIGCAYCSIHYKCFSSAHTATHCNTLQHTATHCNTLQHTATHCNTLQYTTTSSHDTISSLCCLRLVYSCSHR